MSRIVALHVEASAFLADKIADPHYYYAAGRARAEIIRAPARGVTVRKARARVLGALRRLTKAPLRARMHKAKEAERLLRRCAEGDPDYPTWA